jgi:hypothetical protein
MEDEKKITIRIPNDLHERLVKVAEKDVRSLNSEIVVLLREALENRSALDRSKPSG